MRIEHGDILVTSCEGLIIPCWHRAIVLYEQGGWWVYQNTPSMMNEFGGNIVRVPIEDFLNGRKVFKVINARLDADCVRACSWKNRERKWRSIGFNCEDYVNEIESGKKKSSLRGIYALGTIAALALIK